MTASEARWPAYTDDEFPEGASKELLRQIRALDHLSKQSRVSLGTYYVFRKLTRDQEFVNGINNTKAVTGLRIVVGAIIRDLVIGINTLFDDDQRATDIRRIIKAIRDRRNAEVFKKFHSEFPVPYDTEGALKRFEKYWHYLQNSPTKDSLSKMGELRNKAVAHIDIEAEFKRGRPIIKDIDRLMIFSLAVITDANVFCVGRSIDAVGVRRICRDSANDFASALVLGASSLRA